MPAPSLVGSSAFCRSEAVARRANQRAAQGATASRRTSTMKRNLSLLMAAGSIAIAPAAAFAAPPSGGGGAAAHQPATTTTATPNSPTGNGGGSDHMNSPQHTTGQPMQSCETTGSPPGNSASAPGSAFNPNGNAGTKYAGEQPQNSRNTASVSRSGLREAAAIATDPNLGRPLVQVSERPFLFGRRLLTTRVDLS